HVSFLLSWQCWLCGRDFAERFRPRRFKIHRTWTALRSQKRICTRNKAKGCTMPRDLKLFYFAFFSYAWQSKKDLAFYDTQFFM
ncbi:hypothetical protein GBAR_LOCUS2286, partial [Geodia barretti]